MSDCPVGLLVDLSLPSPDPMGTARPTITIDGNAGETKDNPENNCPVGLLVDLSLPSPDPMGTARPTITIDGNAGETKDNPENNCPVGLLVDLSLPSPDPMGTARPTITIDGNAGETKDNPENKTLKKEYNSSVKKQASSKLAVEITSPVTFVSSPKMNQESHRGTHQDKTIEDWSLINVDSFNLSDFLDNLVPSAEKEIKKELSLIKSPGHESSKLNISSITGVEKDEVPNKEESSAKDVKPNDQLTPPTRSPHKTDQSGSDKQKGSSRLRRKGTFTVKDKEATDALKQTDWSLINVDSFNLSDFLDNLVPSGDKPRKESEKFVLGIEADDVADKVKRCVSMLTQSSREAESTTGDLLCGAEKEIKKELSLIKSPGHESSKLNISSITGVEKDEVPNKEESSAKDVKPNDQLTPPTRSPHKTDQSGSDKQKGSLRLRRKGTFTVKDKEATDALKQTGEMSEKDINSTSSSKDSAPIPVKKSLPKPSGLTLKSLSTTQKTTDKVAQPKPGHSGKRRLVRPARKSLQGSTVGSLQQSRSVRKSLGSQGTAENYSINSDCKDTSTSFTTSTNLSKVPKFFPQKSALGKPVKAGAVFVTAGKGRNQEQKTLGRMSSGGNTRESDKVVHMPTTGRRCSLQIPASYTSINADLPTHKSQDLKRRSVCDIANFPHKKTCLPSSESEAKKRRSECTMMEHQSKTGTENCTGAATPVKAKKCINPKKLVLPSKIPWCSNSKRV
ncbi:uncharacterized protein LOC135471046 [Liolophura sinensis]|uniref:uncharacterized protein LOC135471046 n=1 Tax=Liolophura sinensis TaxID=3198878 RepID=UPI003159702C